MGWIPRIADVLVHLKKQHSIKHKPMVRNKQSNTTRATLTYPPLPLPPPPDTGSAHSVLSALMHIIGIKQVTHTDHGFQYKDRERWASSTAPNYWVWLPIPLTAGNTGSPCDPARERRLCFLKRGEKDITGDTWKTRAWDRNVPHLGVKLILPHRNLFLGDKKNVISPSTHWHRGFSPRQK